MKKERIIAIDALRGFALLGILLMNMSSFAMPSAAYSSPTVYGGDDFWNRLVFGLSHIFADQKMMGLFSMLFGASVLLATSNIEKRGESPFKFYYSRNFWLLILGFLHSILLWDGDILMVYALCSFVLYWFRKTSPKWQLVWGLLVFLIPSLFSLWANSVVQPTNITYYQSYGEVSQAEIDDELSHYRDPYIDQALYRLSYYDWLEDPSNSTSEAFPGSPRAKADELVDLNDSLEYFFRAFGLMLAGMALYTWGIFSAQHSKAFYKRMALVGFGIGLPFAIFSLYQYNMHNWRGPYTLFIASIPNNIATPLIACGYVALIMLWSQSGHLPGLHKRLAAVGRIALTNYIAHSLISTFLFYGFGLSLFGYLDRIQQILVILAIWIFQLITSLWWLERFRYGPLEWLWRSLTYGRLQPLRIETN